MRPVFFRASPKKQAEPLACGAPLERSLGWVAYLGRRPPSPLDCVSGLRRTLPQATMFCAVRRAVGSDGVSSEREHMLSDAESGPTLCPSFLSPKRALARTPLLRNKPCKLLSPLQGSCWVGAGTWGFDSRRCRESHPRLESAVPTALKRKGRPPGFCFYH